MISDGKEFDVSIWGRFNGTVPFVMSSRLSRQADCFWKSVKNTEKIHGKVHGKVRYSDPCDKQSAGTTGLLP